MTTLSTRPLYRAEYFILLTLAAVLPALEASKNLACVLWLGLWLINSIRHGEGLSGWSMADSVFASFIAAALVSVALAAPWPSQWGEVLDVLRYTSLGWLLSRTRLTARQAVSLLMVVALATAATALHGYWASKISHQTTYLELKSVGHVNHSALYLAMVASGCFAALLATLRQPRLSWKLCAIALFAPLAGLVLMGESRGAAIALSVSFLVILMAFRQRIGLRIVPVVLALAVLSGLALWQAPRPVEKMAHYHKTGNLSSYRLQLMNTSIEAFRQKPLTGIGAGNFHTLSQTAVQQWVEARGEVFVRPDFFFSSHAHSLFSNTLAERGLLGLAALALLLGFWLVMLVRGLPRTDEPVPWVVWGAGAAAFLVTVIGGLFNTSLHHEHGLLAMLGLGVMLGCLPSPAKV